MKITVFKALVKPMTLVVLAAVLATAACGPVVRTRGNLLTDDVLARVTVGQSTADDVAASLGPPSTTSTFEQGVWYYVGQRTEKKAFLAPEVVERRIVKIAFTQDGRVDSIEELGLDEANEILVVERETPTLGRQITFFEQLLGNLGRFNTAGN